jgi:hypothetical protein
MNKKRSRLKVRKLFPEPTPVEKEIIAAALGTDSSRRRFALSL